MAKKVIIWIVVIALIIWGIVAASGDGSKTSDTTDTSGSTIKIGIITPLTGDGAVYGEMVRNVNQIAVDEINAAGGIKGKQVELITEDGKCKGEGGVNAAQKLVNVDKVQIIIGGFCSAETLSAVPVAEAGKVAVMSAGSSNPGLTNKSPFFFRNFPSDSIQGAILAQVAYDSGKRKVAFIQEQTDYTAGIFKAFETKFKSLGGEVVNESYAPTVRDFRSQLAKLQAAKPDALFLDANTPASMEAITQQFGVMNWNVSLYTNDVILGASDVLTKYKKTLEGMIGAEFGVDANNAKFKHLSEAYTAKYGKDLPYQSYAQTVYDSLFIIKDAINTVGYDGTKIADFGHKITNWQGAAGSVTIGSDGDITSGHQPRVVKDGKVMPYVK